MLLANHQKLHHKFFEFYIHQDSILLKGSSETTLSQESNTKNRTNTRNINWLIRHFLSHKAFRNKFYCNRISTDNFITHFFESYSIQEQILMREGNYQLRYYTFLGFSCIHKQTLILNSSRGCVLAVDLEYPQEL